MKQKNNCAYTAGELAEYVNGDLKGDTSRLIRGVSGISESTSETVTFAEGQDNIKQAGESKAGLVIVSGDRDGALDKDLLLVEEPRVAYARISRLFQPDVFYKPGIHSSSVISRSAHLGENISVHPNVVIAGRAEIGDNVILAPGVYIGENVRIGANTVIHPNVVIEYNCRLGTDVIIHAGTVIGSDGYGFATDEDGHHKIAQLGRVIIEDKVEIGANVTVDRGTSGPTVIKRGSKIDNLVQIAHNVRIGEENLLVAQVGVAGSSRLGKRVTLAGKTGVIDHVEIGDKTVIASNSLVTKDIPAGVFYSGSPAHDHKQELKQQAVQRKLPALLSRVRKLEKKIEELEGEK